VTVRGFFFLSGRDTVAKIWKSYLLNTPMWANCISKCGLALMNTGTGVLLTGTITSFTTERLYRWRPQSERQKKGRTVSHTNGGQSTERDKKGPLAYGLSMRKSALRGTSRAGVCWPASASRCSISAVRSSAGFRSSDSTGSDDAATFLSLRFIFIDHGSVNGGSHLHQARRAKNALPHINVRWALDL
jgi:hypothetical protein